MNFIGMCVCLKQLESLDAFHSNDIVDVSNRHGNNTLAVKTTKPGHVMLKVEILVTRDV